jgi:hypothetical protein
MWDGTPHVLPPGYVLAPKFEADGTPVLLPNGQPVIELRGAGPNGEPLSKPMLFFAAEAAKRQNPIMGTLDKCNVLKGTAVGVSYSLKPDEPGETINGEPVYYCAARLSGELLAKARRGEPIYLRVYNPAILEAGVVRSVLVRVIDWGPIRLWSQRIWEAAGKPAGVTPGVTPWRFKIDIAPGAYRALGLTATADFVWWEVLC